MTSPLPCTCTPPLAVDLRQSSSSPEDATEASSKNSYLIQNFQTHGWSPIVVTVPGISPPCQAQILQAFQEQGHQRQDHVTYRHAESGAVGTVEPKESLEVSISNLFDLGDIGDNMNDTPSRRVSGWCRALQQVAFQVEQALSLPSNLLLDSDPTTSLDLMRAFHYHAVKDQDKNNHKENNDKALILGSSPHTDWGSLTVVWQDDVGGLQTYCHACHTYRNVAPSPTTFSTDETKDSWNCIVHVGDVTSLALTLAGSSLLSSKLESSSHQVMQWPSPKHRVVSQDRVRTSLVYFGYPPPYLSLQDVTSALATCAPKSTSETRTRLPLLSSLNDYYLLKNQSTETNVDPATVLQSIQHQPLGEVFADKWNQVQR